MMLNPKRYERINRNIMEFKVVRYDRKFDM